MQVTPIDRPALISLLPGFLFFTTSLIASSKALAGVCVAYIWMIDTYIWMIDKYLWMIDTYIWMIDTYPDISSPPPSL